MTGSGRASGGRPPGTGGAPSTGPKTARGAASTGSTDRRPGGSTSGRRRSSEGRSRAGRPAAPARPADGPGVEARRLAADAVVRIEAEGAYANLVLPALLERSDLEARDRGLVTELVYGTTRMRRACDWLVDRFLTTPPDDRARALLRLGAYQLAFLDTPAHAAVDATVGAAPKRVRGLVNAVLRRVADAPRDWPDDATRLSFPDWIVDRLTADLGADDALAALDAMNRSASVHTRADGYVQDPASTAVAAAVDVPAGALVVDVCAAPGGKATAIAGTGGTRGAAGVEVGAGDLGGVGARVVAADLRPSRVGLVAANADRLGCRDRLWPVVADGQHVPVRPGAADAVLVDAPCSGLGVLRRRPDARWRIAPGDVDRLADLQRRLLAEARTLVRPGGLLVYSVCTLTAAETVGIDEWLTSAMPELVAVPPPPATDAAPWRPVGRGARLLPHDAGTDGMFLLRLTTPA
ncbi:MAG: transcription antitermination factor NusB [Acidimicrobiales bacterium]